jgi:hypothetical protein
MISLLSSIEIDPNTCVLNESKKVLTHFALYVLPTQIQHPQKKGDTQHWIKLVLCYKRAAN